MPTARDPVGRGASDLAMTADAVAFASRYGPWALVAGASEGLGAEFARQLAAHGLHLVLVARRRTLLEAVAARLEARYGVATRTLALDLAGPEAARTLREATADLEVGLLVYNAAVSPIGPFLELDLADQLRALDTNCRTPLALAHEFGRAMAARGRGGILLVSSMAALQGSPRIASYAATKAFELVLGEGLWEELRRHGIDVLAFCAGATRTPRYAASQPAQAGLLAPAVMEPDVVASQALAKLGRGPRAIAGRGNRLAAFVMSRLLPRRTAVRIMAHAARARYSPQGRPPPE